MELWNDSGSSGPQADQAGQEQNQKRVCFASKTLTLGQGSVLTVEMTYDLGSDGNYLSDRDRAKLRLPILRKSHEKVGVANGDTSKGENLTSLSFDQLSGETAEASRHI